MPFETPRIFQEQLVPAETQLVGWAALAHNFSLEAPVRTPSCVSNSFIRGQQRTENGWTIYDKRFAPDATLRGHLSFALKSEPLDLLVLKRLFTKIPKEDVEAFVRAEPNGIQSRRAWFFYEWLTSERLDIEDAVQGNYIDAIDPRAYFTAGSVNSPRHRVRDNMLGVSSFCPVVRRTPELENFVGSRWDTQAKEVIGKISKGVIARAASFMLLADSQASYQIEGERPPRNRLERWMRAVAQAGKQELSIDELERLQHIVIEDNRFIATGLRAEGGFIGDRDNDYNPLPEFVSARHDDLQSLVTGLIDANQKMSANTADAVLQATCTAFGFVFMHPFEDGNGRVHRYLIHHVLAERQFTPPGMVFPVSSVLLDKIEEYRTQLKNFSGALMPFIEWVPTPEKNVRVLNDTADLYRYGDYTDLVQFIYGCVVRTITIDLPKEISFLKAYDRAKVQIQDMIDMPDNLLGNLIKMIQQNDGKLSKKRRNKDFAKLTDEEVLKIEDIVNDAFEEEEDDLDASFDIND